MLLKVYALYGKGGKGLFGNQKYEKAYLSRPLVRLVTANRRRLDFDPIVNGQDYEITDLHVTPKGGTEKDAVAEVTFKNFGEPVTLTYDLVLQDSAWRIDNIVSKDKDAPWILTELLGKGAR